MPRIVFSYARMNPPTSGHRLLVDAVKEAAQLYECDHLIVTSRTQDGVNNPIPAEDKVGYIRDVLGTDFNLEVATADKPSLVQWLVDLYEDYDKLTFVCGSDRLDEYRDLIYKYNGRVMVLDYPLFNYLRWEVISSGDRDSPGNTVSSSLVREAVRAGDHDAFVKLYSGTPISPDRLESMYSTLSGALSINREKGHRHGKVTTKEEV